MALVKVIYVGDELLFDLKGMADDAKKEISVTLVERGGQMAVLRISAHRSIPIIHIRQERVWDEKLSFIKMINVGDELLFNLKNMDRSIKKELSFMLIEKAGKMAVLRISAHKSIPIIHSKQVRLGEQKGA